MRSAPAAATWLLEQSCSRAEHESVTGDLLEQYHLGRGRLWYWRQVFVIVFLRLYREGARRPEIKKDWLPARRNSVLLLRGFALLLLVAAFMAPEAFEIGINGGLAFFLFVVVPWGILGSGMVFCWYKRYPYVVQALVLHNRKARSRSRISVPPLRTVLGLQ